MAIGDIITAVDYNTIYNKISGILGVGSGQSGYGQTFLSSSVAANSKVTAAQWDNLRLDVIRARVHQAGTPTITDVNTGDDIAFANYTQYNTLADLCIADKFSIAVGQSFEASLTSPTDRTGSWTTSCTATVTINFASASQARWFFNSGGSINFLSSRTGGTTTGVSGNKNTAWSNFLSTTVGKRLFNAPFFYSATLTNQTFVNLSNTDPYELNSFNIQYRGNFAPNASGGATQLVFTIEWLDGEGETFGRTVDGTLSLLVSKTQSSDQVFFATDPIASSAATGISGS